MINQSLLLKTIKAGVFFVLLTPFVFSKKFYFPYVGPKSLFFLALAEIIFFSWIFLILKNKKFRFKSNILTTSIVIMLLVFLISAIFGVNPSLSFWSKFERMTGLLALFHLFALYLVISSVFEKKDWLQVFSISISAGAIMGLVSILEKDPTMRGGGMIGNDSFLGAYLIFNLFISIYLFCVFRKERTSKFKEIFLAVCFGLMAYALFESSARAAQLVFAGGLALFFILWLASKENKYLRIGSLSVLALGLTALIIFIVLASQTGNVLYDKISEKFGVETIYGRIVVWETAWQGFSGKPFLGWGPENFDSVFAHNYNPCMGNNICTSFFWFDRAHNIIFDTLSATGILGLISYLGVFAAAFYSLLKNYLSKKIGFSEIGVFIPLFVAYFIQNLTVFDTINSYLMWFLCLGYISFLDKKESEPEQKKNPKKYRQSNNYLPWVFFAVFLFCISNFVIGPLKTDYYVVEASKQPFGSEARFDYYKKTFDASPMGKFQIRVFFAQAFLNETNNPSSTLTPERKIRELEYLTGELEKSVSEAPFDYKSRLVLGQLYSAWTLLDYAKIELAQKQFLEALELSPTNQQGYWNLAQVMIYRRNFDEALTVAKKAYDLEPTLAQSSTVVAEIERLIASQKKNSE